MRKILVMIVCFWIAVITFADDETKFYEFLGNVEKTAVEQRMDFTTKEFEKIKGEVKFPIVGKKEITFVYFGTAKTKIAYVIGDFTNWESNPVQMNKIEGTNMFVIKKEFPENARIEYMFKRKGAAQYEADALSGKMVSNGMGGKNCVVEMPGYKLGIENQGVEEQYKGKIEKFQLNCKSVLDGSNQVRNVAVYTPNGYTGSKKYNTIYFFDGTGYMEEEHGNAKNILDYMVKNGEIEPTIGVFIDPIDRDQEMVLAERTKFMEYIVKEIIPWVESKYSVKNDAQSRIAAGISNGGFFVTDLLYRYPDKFGGVLSGSRVGSRHDDNVADYTKFVETMNIKGKIFMATGEYDEFLNDGKEYYEALKKNKNLKSLKFVTKYDGHNWRFWRDVLREGLLWQKEQI